MKLNAAGEPRWLHAFGDGADSGFEGHPDDLLSTVAIAKGGSIVAVGIFDGSVDWGGGTLFGGKGVPSNDIIVARYSP